MPDLIVNSLPGAVIALIGLLLGVVAYRRFNTKQLGEIQEKVIATYKSQNEVQETQIKTLEKKVQRLEGVISTLQYTLKERRRLRLEVRDEYVILTDERTGAEITVPVQIHVNHQEEEKL